MNIILVECLEILERFGDAIYCIDQALKIIPLDCDLYLKKG